MSHANGKGKRRLRPDGGSVPVVIGCGPHLTIRCNSPAWAEIPKGERVGTSESIEAHSLLQAICNCGELLKCGFEVFDDLKLVCCPRSLAPTLVTLPSMSLTPFAPFSGDHFGTREIGAVFESLRLIRSIISRLRCMNRSSCSDERVNRTPQSQRDRAAVLLNESARVHPNLTAALRVPVDIAVSSAGICCGRSSGGRHDAFPEIAIQKRSIKREKIPRRRCG
jgi:hypothetical protein